jgi:uncharacterized protein (DUF2461 family)
MTKAPTRFAGFRPAAFAFFRELRDNNDPAWFKPRKAVYEAEVLGPFRELFAAVDAALREAGLPLIGDARHGIFRIYRDVRFSPDKRLYKTHAGAVLTRSGRRNRWWRPGSGTPSPIFCAGCDKPSSTIPMHSSPLPMVWPLWGARFPATSG